MNHGQAVLGRRLNFSLDSLWKTCRFSTSEPLLPMYKDRLVIPLVLLDWQPYSSQHASVRSTLSAPLSPLPLSLSLSLYTWSNITQLVIRVYSFVLQYVLMYILARNMLCMGCSTCIEKHFLLYLMLFRMELTTFRGGVAAAFIVSGIFLRIFNMESNFIPEILRSKLPPFAWKHVISNEKRMHLKFYFHNAFSQHSSECVTVTLF